MRFTEEELSLLKIFKDEKLLKLLRKVFFPRYDYDAPIGQTIDMLWVGLEQLGQMSPQDRELAILSQIRLNSHIERQLMQLQFLANRNEESEDDKKKRIAKDSAK